VTRVGFAFPPWIGGVNYLQNLFTALAALPESGIEPILFAGRRDRPPAGFPAVEVVRTPMLDVGDPRWFVRLTLRRLVAADHLMARLLRRHRVDLWSHSTYLGRGAGLPAVGWVEDLQVRLLPEFFPPRELAARDAAHRATCRHSRLVVVSSEAVRADVERLYPEARGKLRVLRFVDCSSPDAEVAPLPELCRRHGFEGPFLLLPNQFWAHKNHGLVVEALRILKASGRAPLVLATGTTHDSRRPAYFAELMARVRAAGLEATFRPLGLVPYADLAALYRHALAVLNPSLFEGWSTSVEEGKSLGKRVLLSDIPVHREQAPERGVYFDPRSPEQLAEALWQAWTSADPAAERTAAERARAALPGRRQAFAQGYLRIVREVIPA